MTILRQRPLVFDNACGCVVDEEILARAMLAFTDKPLLSRKRIFMYGRYPAISIHGQKIHIHRLVAWYCLATSLVAHLVVHHRDGNPLNCAVANLAIITDSIHATNHLKGRSLSAAHKAKIAKANRARKGHQIAKRVDIDLGVLHEMLAQGRSINAIARHFHVDWSTISARIHENPELVKAE